MNKIKVPYLAKYNGGVSIIKNFSVLTFGGVLSQLAVMIVNVLLARHLEPLKFGEYTLLITYITILNTVASLGLRQVVIRTIARNQQNSKAIFYQSICLRLLGFLLSIIVLYLYIKITASHFSYFFYIWLLLGVWAESFWEAFQNVAFGMQKVISNSIVNVTGNFLLLFIIIALPASVIDFEMAVILFVSIFLFKDAFYLICLFKAGLLTSNKSELIQESSLQTMLSQSMPFYMLALFSLISTQAPILMLENRSGVIEVGYFNSANKLLLPISLLGTTLFSAVFPFLAQSYKKDFNNFVQLVKKTLFAVSVGGTMAAFFVSLFRKELVLILFGTSYTNTGDVIAYQCWFVVLGMIFSLIGNVFGASDKQKLLAYTSIVYALISFPILYFASAFGAVGLSFGYIIMGGINMTYNYYYLLKVVDFKIENKFSVILFSSIFFFWGISVIMNILDNQILNLLAIITIFLIALWKRNEMAVFFESYLKHE